MGNYFLKFIIFTHKAKIRVNFIISIKIIEIEIDKLIVILP